MIQGDADAEDEHLDNYQDDINILSAIAKVFLLLIVITILTIFSYAKLFALFVQALNVE